MTDETADRASSDPAQDVVDLTAEVPAVDLTPVAFLRPDQPGTTPMPADVWDRLASALAGEARTRTAAASSGPASDADEPAPVIPISRARSSRPMRWAGGLVAAGVVVVAGAAVIPGVIGGTAIVATDPATSVLAEGGARASTPSTAAANDAASQVESGPADAGEAAPLAAADAASSSEPAAKVVLASNTVYAPTTLRDQVADLVRSRFGSVEEAMAAPSDGWLPPDAGFTQTWAALRDCLTALTQSPDATALVVDRGTYQGEPAGVIVAPDTGVDYAAAGGTGPSASPTETVLTAEGLFDVWVVDQECERPSMTTLDNIALFAR